MNKNQSNAFNMFKAVLVVLNSFPTVWNSNATINAVVSAFQSVIGNLIGSEQNQRTGTIGVTQTKAQVLNALINVAIAVADAGYAYAVSVDDLQLKKTCNLNITALGRAKDVDIIALCQNLHDAVNPIVGNLAAYGANAAGISALQTAITAFSNITGAPADARAAVKVATKNIAQEVADGKKTLKDELDPLMTQFKSSNALFYNRYFAARMIDDIGHRKTVILKGGVYTAQHLPIANVTIKVSGSAVRNKISGADGLYKIARLHTGTFTIVVSASGYVTQTKTLTVAENGTVLADFVMQAVGGSGPVVGVPTSSDERCTSTELSCSSSNE